MTDQIDHEVLILHWRGAESSKFIADKIVEKLAAKLFAAGGDTLLYLADGEFITVNTAGLQELVGTLFDTVQVRRMSDGRWAAERVPLVVDRRAFDRRDRSAPTAPGKSPAASRAREANFTFDPRSDPVSPVH
jgi:hypothetical protein